MTEKKDGTIKARQSTDGQTQRNFINKENAASPTVTSKMVFLTCVIKVKEGREVAVVDFLEASLHADNKDDLVMFMKKRLTELMIMVAPQRY